MKLRTFFWKTHKNVQGHQTQNFPTLIPVLVQDGGELKLVKSMKKKQILDSYGVTMKEAPTVEQKTIYHSLKNSCLDHTTPEEFAMVRPTVHTNPSPNRSFSKMFFKLKGFENVVL